ncbi:MAG: hypothetical protein V4635_00215 [Bacteroidota bacterium]
MKPITNKLLLITVIVTAVLFLTAAFHENLGMKPQHASILIFVMLLNFGANVAGLIVGISEKRKGKKNAVVGIIGNSLLILFFLGLSGYAISIIQ